MARGSVVKGLNISGLDCFGSRWQQMVVILNGKMCHEEHTKYYGEKTQCIFHNREIGSASFISRHHFYLVDYVHQMKTFRSVIGKKCIVMGFDTCYYFPILCHSWLSATQILLLLVGTRALDWTAELVLGSVKIFSDTCGQLPIHGF